MFISVVFVLNLSNACEEDRCDIDFIWWNGIWAELVITGFTYCDFCVLFVKHLSNYKVMSGYQSSNMAAGEVWLQWFSCCINQPAQQRKRQQRRRGQVRIDRSMIGEPTNFQHTGHIGSGDVELGNSRLRAIQNQMQSKGGYETAFTTVKACWVAESGQVATFHDFTSRLECVYIYNKTKSKMDLFLLVYCFVLFKQMFSDLCTDMSWIMYIIYFMS